MLRAETLRRTTHEWIGLLEAAGVPCGPINNIAQVFEDPQVVARGMKITMTHPEAGDIPLVASPIRMSQTPAAYELPPPRLGEHTRAVLGSLLALDDAECDRLAADRVI